MKVVTVMVSLSFMYRLAALMGLSAVWLVLLCTPALAHSRLVQSDPASGANLSQPPKQVRLQFNEHIEAEFSPVKVFDEQGNRVDEDDAQVDPNDPRVVVADLNELPSGNYTVEWRVISADTHPVNGTYEFAVTGAGTDESRSAAQAQDGGAGGSKEQPSDQSEPGSNGQQDAGSIGPHLLHFVALGLGVIVVIVLTLWQRIKGKRSS